MAQKWYQKASVQAALVGGVFLIIAALVSGMFDHFQPGPRPSPDTQPNDVMATRRASTLMTNESLESLPLPGEQVQLGRHFEPPTLVGLKLDKDDPFHIDFILDKGDSALDGQALSDEAMKLIKYFLTALTIPEHHLWVNLSPYEEESIIPDDFASTQMGRDLLAQDYILKQLAASLTYPETDLGSLYWRTIYQRLRAELGTEDLPVNTFNKVWIIPDKASVILSKSTALITSSSLSVLTDQDYLASKMNQPDASADSEFAAGEGASRVTEIASEVTKLVLIPELQNEVNHSDNFAVVRQAYQSLILATWYKQTLRSSLLSQAVANQGELTGLTEPYSDYVDKLYGRYVEAFNTGVYNYIREDYVPGDQAITPRKYFSGGITAKGLGRIIADRSSRKKLRLRSLQAAAILVHTVMLTSGSEALAASDMSQLAGTTPPVVEAYSEDPGGIDFGREFKIDEIGAEQFEFEASALINSPEIGGLLPKILGMIAFPNLATLIDNESH